MPVQVAIYPSNGKKFTTTFQVNEKKNEFSIPLDTAPLNVILDPDGWILMNAKWAKK